MSLLDRWRNRNDSVELQVAAPRELEVVSATESKALEKKEFVLGLTDSFGQFMQFGNGGNGSTATSALHLYETSSAVSIPINMIVDPFRSLEPVLLIDDVIQPDHEITQLLRNPSPYFTKQLFFETIARDFLITGETMVAALGNINQPPLELQPISPKVVTVPEGTGGYPSRFAIAGNTLAGDYTPEIVGRDVRYYDGNLRELRQIRNYSTKNNSMLRGQSRLVSCAKEVRQHVLGGEHNVSLLERGGSVSLVFHFDADLNDEDFEDLKNRVRAQYGGARNAGEIAVTTGGKLDIKTAGTNNRDMDFAVLHKMAQRAVALQYRVPLPLVSDERQTLNNYAEGKLALYDDAVIPLADVVFGGLSRFILPRFGLDPRRAKIWFDPDKVTALVKRRNEEVKLRAEIGVETVDELRALLGREPLTIGGDSVYISATMIPLGQDAFTEDNDPKFVEDVGD